jgi:hypothetical protein
MSGLVQTTTGQQVPPLRIPFPLGMRCSGRDDNRFGMTIILDSGGLVFSVTLRLCG